MYKRVYLSYKCNLSIIRSNAFVFSISLVNYKRILIILHNHLVNNVRYRLKCGVPIMRYIMTIIWSLLISLALAFVLTSMAGDPFILSEALILAVVFVVIIAFLGDGVLKEESK